MILEGLVTTLSTTEVVNVAPMGPTVPDTGTDWTTFILRPFRTSRTYANLKAHPEGVLHITDDVLLLARAALGEVSPPPPMVPATHVRGQVLADTCRAYEFRVSACDETGDRTRFQAEVVHTIRCRDFFGLNRAKHAVVEAAILATRTAFLPLDEIESELSRLAILVQKTGGPNEHQAFNLLQEHLQAVRDSKQSE